LWQESNNSKRQSATSSAKGSSFAFVPSVVRNGKHSAPPTRTSLKSLASQPPTYAELCSVEFSWSNTFEVGEEVLIARSRGGFTRGTVTKQLLSARCMIDPQVHQPCDYWRVDYQGTGATDNSVALSSSSTYFKELPAILIGKRRAFVDVPIAPDELDPPSAAPPERVIGQRPSMRDLRNVVLAAETVFSEGEVVLVPRSGGGFTYGRLLKPSEVKCKLHPESGQPVAAENGTPSSSSSSHLIPAWRVLLTANSSAFKEVAHLLLGKVELTNEQRRPTGSRRRHNEVRSSGTGGNTSADTLDETLMDPRLAVMKESEVQRALQEAAEREQQRQERERLRVERELEAAIIRRRRQRNVDAERNDSEEPGVRVTTANQDDEMIDDIDDRDSQSDEIVDNVAERLTYVDVDEDDDNNSKKKLSKKKETSANELAASTTTTTTGSATTTEPAPNAPMLQVGGVLAVNKQDLLRKLMNPAAKSLTAPDPEKPLIVIDGPNAAKVD
jgi:hypothetical protein